MSATGELDDTLPDGSLKDDKNLFESKHHKDTHLDGTHLNGTHTHTRDHTHINGTHTDGMLTDDDLRSEIEMVSELVVAATSSDGPLDQDEVDLLLGVTVHVTEPAAEPDS